MSEAIVTEYSWRAKVSSAFLYATTSFLIVIVNKIILTSYEFKSFTFLGFSQCLCTVVVLSIACRLGYMDFPLFSLSSFRKVWPLPLLYVGNLLCGLGSTKSLSLPMFTVLRRFSILLTMILEFFILGIKAPYPVQISVAFMIAGALIAAWYDITFSVVSYLLIMANNVFTASNNVLVKKKLEAKEMGQFALLYYNSLSMLLPLVFLLFYTDEFVDVVNFSGWYNAFFILLFSLSVCLGTLVQYSIMLCSLCNSPLTTCVVGLMKNLSVTYIGMVVGRDYVFSALNFLGVNVSCFGSIIYTYVTFRRKSLSKASAPSGENRV